MESDGIAELKSRVEEEELEEDLESGLQCSQKTTWILSEQGELVDSSFVKIFLF